MNRHSPHRDLTARQHDVQPSVAPTLAFICGNKGLRSGAQMRGAIPYRCASCAKAKRAAA